MTDYATEHVTVEKAADDGVIGVQWFQKAEAYFGPEMQAQTAEVTAPYGTGGSAARPTTGLVWPR